MMNNISLAVSASQTMDTFEDVELQQRLSLYQVFLRLYEHHRGLLDEILMLENSGSRSLAGVTMPYIQAVVQAQQAYLVTNLLGGSSQTLTQQQQVWTLGRDARQVGVPIQDRRLSRCHAAIRYVDAEGFYLVDLDSSNGSYVNGERIHHPHRLKDGDRIRLGSMTIAFFLCSTALALGDLTPDLRDRIDRATVSASEVASPPMPAVGKRSHPSRLDDTLKFLRSNPPQL
jgi:hypothetical protein